MRVLILLTGSGENGWSDWLCENGLSDYTLSSNAISRLCTSPALSVSGEIEHGEADARVIRGLLLQMLEIRMQNGEFTVIDAEDIKASQLNMYRELCSRYRYTAYSVEPNNTDEILDAVRIKPMDMSAYKAVHHIGDIHGCNTVLMEYFALNGGMKDDEAYIFCGDYIDRGTENAEVVRFLLSIYNKPNVILLEGNHEKWLWHWANDMKTPSMEFETATRQQLDSGRISKKEVRKLYRSTRQCVYYVYGGNTVLVTHGGLSKFPEELLTVSAAQMIKGVGGYDDFKAMADAFANTAPENCYQIHGHRNTENAPIRVNERVFNLEGRIEFGGHLRCVQVYSDGIFKTFEIKNSVYKEALL